MTTVSINPLTDRAAWLAERRNGIGASEAAMALGLSPFGSPTELALRKLGRLPEAEENEAMELGSLLEPVVAELYQRRTGRHIVSQQVYRKDLKHPFLFATVDGVDQESELVEFKTTGAMTSSAKELGEEGTDEVPMHWLVQAHQQMYVCRKDVVNFAVLIGGQSFRQFRVKRNQALIDSMLPTLTKFWDQVSRGEVPQDDATVYSPRILAALNPECEGEIEAVEQLAELVADYEYHKSSQAEHAKRIGDLKTGILWLMSTNQFANLPDGRRIRRYLLPVAERTQTVKAHVKHYFQIVKGNS